MGRETARRLAAEGWDVGLIARGPGPVGLWVDNAMASLLSPVMDASADEYRRVTEVHLPAVNSPRFGWVRARTRGRPAPAPPRLPGRRP